MALPLKITVKESIKELRELQRKNGELICKRLLVLIEFKKHKKQEFQNEIYQKSQALTTTVLINGETFITSLELLLC